MRFGRAYTAAGEEGWRERGSRGQGMFSFKGAHLGLPLKSLVAVFFRSLIDQIRVWTELLQRPFPPPQQPGKHLWPWKRKAVVLRL